MTRILAVWLTLLVCAGCSTVWLSRENAGVKTEIAQAEYMAARGNYEGATATYERILERSPQNPWRDRVLFSLGGLYAQEGNPKQDFARSLTCFRTLKAEFPESRFEAESQVWACLLEKIVSLGLDLKAKEAELAERQAGLEQEIGRLETERRELEASLTAEIKGKEDKLRELESLIQTQKTALETLQQQLKKMKEIDIKAEKKATGIK